MNFQETLDKLCLMAVVPHHPKCPAGMDSRLKCECNAGMVRLKVEGCRVNLSKMYESAVAAMTQASTTPAPALPVKEAVIDSPPQNRRPVAIEGTALPSRDTVPLIETPSFARGQQEASPPPPAAAPQVAGPTPTGPNGLPPGPRTAAVPVTKRPR
jgi:hypothetical protein